MVTKVSILLFPVLSGLLTSELPFKTKYLIPEFDNTLRIRTPKKRAFEGNSTDIHIT